MALRILCTSILLALVWITQSPAQAAIKHQIDIPAQELGSALAMLARQAKIQVVYSTELVEGQSSHALTGSMTPEEALSQLLAKTGLKYDFIDAQTVTLSSSTGSNVSPSPAAIGVPQGTTTTTSVDSSRLRLAQAVAAPQSETGESERRSERGQQSDEVDLGEIVVVGTNIRGVYPSSSPLEIYTAEDIRRSGATTTEQFIGRLPQNVGTRTEYAPTSGSSSNFNREAISTPTLRGLGVGTTLTLLNGRRLPLASNGQAADVSTIPLAAIERIEVLTDGASAIYGSDAIGGVVNFVLRDDFDGAETRLSYGGVTSGDLRQFNATQTFGGKWNTGHGLISYDYFDTSALAANDRDYTFDTGVSGQGDLTPIYETNRAFATVSQNLGDSLTVEGDFGFSRREVKLKTVTTTSTTTGAANTHWSESDQYFVNLGVDFEVTDAMKASIMATHTETDADTFYGVSQTSPGQIFDTNYSALDLTAKLDGELFRLPAGVVRFVLGVDHLDEDYVAARDSFGSTLSGRELGRTTSAAFGELLVPLVESAQAISLVHRLELSVAARYTSYEDTSDPPLGRDFGDGDSPKVGVSWAPIPSLNLRATYGESFRAPALTQIDPSSTQVALIQNLIVGGVSSTGLQLAGPSDDIDAETAKTYTLGLDYSAAQHPGLRLSTTYYNIDYEDRIGTVSTFAARANPPAWPEVLSQPSSAAEIEELLRFARISFNNTGISDTDLQAASVAVFARMPNLWILETRTRNLALSRQDGIDLSIIDRFETSLGELTLGVNLNHILSFEEQASPNSPAIAVVDTVQRPADLKGTAFFGLAKGGLDSTINIRYVDDYSNPLATTASGGPHDVESWTTVDWTTSYDFDQDGQGLFSGVRLNFTVQNLFDEDPPFVQPATTLGLSPGFDPANANPLGRMIALSVTMIW